MMDGKEYSILDMKECEVVMVMDCFFLKYFVIKIKMDFFDFIKWVS